MGVTGAVSGANMTEWFFILTLFWPTSCSTPACVAEKGQIVATVREVDRAQCEWVRKFIVDQFGKTRDGRINIDGSISECEERRK